MGEMYKKGVLNKRLQPYDARIDISGKESTHLLYKEKDLGPVMVTTSGLVIEDQVERVAKKLSDEGEGKPTDIFSELTKPVSTGLESLATVTLAIFSLGLIVLVSARMGLLTGFAINNIASSTSSIGIIVCVVGILGFLYLRFRVK